MPRVSRTVRSLGLVLVSKWRAANKKRLEAGLWASGLFAVAVADPHAPGLIETCVFKLVGFARCPGCGLGHAIGFLARGEFVLSVQSHPLAFVAVGIMVHHIFKLLRPDSSQTYPSIPPRHYVKSN